MKKLSLVNAVVILACIIFYLVNHFVLGDKIAYVDSNQLINNYQGMIDARQDFQLKAGQWKANIDTLFAEVQNEIKTYEKESVGMTKKERELALKLIDSKKQNFQQYQQAIEQKAQAEDEKMTNAVISEINGFIKSYGEEHGYQIIFGANESGNIVYANKSINLTEEVTEALNKLYNE